MLSVSVIEYHRNKAWARVHAHMSLSMFSEELVCM